MSEKDIKSQFEFKLDDFQLEAINHLNSGKSVVICAPTGAGKTVIAEGAIFKALENNKRVFYTTPLKALSNQKFNDFSVKYGEDKTGLLTGDISINRDAQIVVMTTEVFRNMLYGTNLGRVEENLQNVQFVILDEVHYMNDEQRGTVWEESIIYSPNNIQIVALSATIANAVELTEWINSVHGKTELVNTDFRPVPLKHFYYQGEKEILPLFAPGGKLNSKIKTEKQTPKFVKKEKKENSVSALVKILHEKDMLPAIYFTFSRKKCDDNVKECSKLKLLNQFEERRLLQIIDEYIVDNPYIARHKQLEYLYSGVASHHAGLLPAWKVLIETLFKQGLIKVVFATETLAAGINMPARSTVISSISKRTDDGHRLLTASEFLQMSGRAGRRGMDEVGYVVVVGTPYQSPDEVANLASSASDPLQSKFTSSYSMVLNLLQRFTIEDARELILKSFGYFSSNERLKPLLHEQQRLKETIDEINNLACPYKLTNEDIIQYNKLKNTYIQHRKLVNTLRKQAKQSGRHDAPEVKEYENKAKDFQRQMDKSKCHYCKQYKKHIKNLEILERFNHRYKKIEGVIEYEKDIYWRQFINLMGILNEMDYLENNYPTSNGLTAASIRSENELFFSELILNGVLDGLSPSELAAVLCAITTEDPRNVFYVKFPLSENVRKSVNAARDILKKLYKIQKQYDINTPILLNTQFSAIIEYWTNGGEWEDLIKGMDIGEGDIVRTFKRTMDLLRQLTIIPNVPRNVTQAASVALDNINRDPIAEVF